MPVGQPAPDASARVNADAHRSDLKRNENGILVSRSLSEGFAYLTHGTASLEEAKKLLTIITNVNCIYLCYLLHGHYWHYDTYHSSTLNQQTSNILLSSLCTMAKHVLCAMLTRHVTLVRWGYIAFFLCRHCSAELDGKQVLDFYWTDPIDAMKSKLKMKKICCLSSL